ncbi:hypothetical protein EVAR_46180_1 [Eumeta japonica]|uniref:Uncharacterized protein n=1 Tax=Eumeta variegata TaxID=151549 RepID=A0A4C1Y0D8_EUMVA|nr:hypothetical protein EVAR_46180_1 [Eumeta japonica]
MFEIYVHTGQEKIFLSYLISAFFSSFTHVEWCQSNSDPCTALDSERGPALDLDPRSTIDSNADSILNQDNPALYSDSSPFLCSDPCLALNPNLDPAFDTDSSPARDSDPDAVLAISVPD